MKKLVLILFLCLLSSLIGGIYGVLHDQLTYTISPEYYTKFKFYQFGLMQSGNEAIFSSPRIQVSVVGFMATWWMGLSIGLVLSLVGLIHQDNKRMLNTTLNAIGLIIFVAFIMGLLGLLYGKLYLIKTGVDWSLPDTLIDEANFISVGSMHNFSYLGGAFGLIAGITYHIRQKRKYSEHC